MVGAVDQTLKAIRIGGWIHTIGFLNVGKVSLYKLFLDIPYLHPHNRVRQPMSLWVISWKLAIFVVSTSDPSLSEFCFRLPSALPHLALWISFCAYISQIQRHEPTARFTPWSDPTCHRQSLFLWRNASGIHVPAVSSSCRKGCHQGGLNRYSMLL